MAATVGGALKALIESLGLGVPAYSRRVPPGETMPYVVILDDISFAPGGWEDGKPDTGVEIVQVDLYEPVGAESQTTLDGLLAGLSGAQLGAIGAAAKRVYAAQFTNCRRLEDAELGQVRHSIDVDLNRQV